jgi:hypothetical protein
MRVVFHEREVADRVAARLRADGFGADLVRERFAGEDDDEDHPWSVVTDAPALVVEIVAEEHDGWVDHDDVPTVQPAPRGLELPDGPRRVKRPGDQDQ